MKKILYIFLMLSLLASCADYPVYREISSDEQKRVDSIVRSQQGIDSLTAVAERFMAEGCLVGEVAAYRELGRALRNATRYQEAIDAHSKGLEIAKDIRDTLQVIQEDGNAGRGSFLALSGTNLVREVERYLSCSIEKQGSVIERIRKCPPFNGEGQSGIDFFP